MRALFLIPVICLWMSKSFSAEIDCSEAYGGKAASCQTVACDEKYKSFIGTWSGDFKSYVQELSKNGPAVFRPFTNTVSYSESDCLKNTKTGETFIIGRRVDNYPKFQTLKEEIKPGLLITGKTPDGTPFLRTIDKENGISDYKLDYQNKAANLSIWSFTYPASAKNPELRFTTIDGQDFSTNSENKRNVLVTMSIGPKDAPFWEGVIVVGSHSHKK